jgi:16S rRNA U1498 N3-methylase RsmE
VPRLEAVAPLAEWLREPESAEPDAPAAQARDKVVRILLAPGAPRSLGMVLAALETTNAGETGCGPPRRIEEVRLLCGPESGLSQAEVLQACAAGWVPAGLGPRVLRTETAGLVALAVLQARWGDLR